MRRWIGISIVMLLGAGAIVALVSSGGRSDGESQGVKSAATSGAGSADSFRSEAAPGSTGADVVGSGPNKFDASTPSSTVPGSDVKSAPTPVGAAVPKLDSHVVKHATLDLAVRRGQLQTKFASANGIAAFLGGFVEASEESHGLATVTLRVPSDQFEAALKQLSGLGQVTSRGERGDDVTAQFTDIDARLRNLGAQEGVLQDLMRQAKNIPDTITVQQQLSDVRQQIEELTGQRNVLDHQATYSTIALTMHATGTVPAPASANDRGTIAQAWHDAIGVTVAIFAGTIVVLGAVVPIGLLALVGFAGWSLMRRRRNGVAPAGI